MSQNQNLAPLTGLELHLYLLLLVAFKKWHLFYHHIYQHF